MPSLDGSTALARDFGALLGADRVRPARGPETAAAAVVVEPMDAAELATLVCKCEQDRVALVPVGAARTVAQMRSAPARIAVSLVRMNRVVAYDPADMTITVEAGALLDAVNQVTGAHGQRLPVDPPQPSATTVGSLIAGAKAGPLRLSEGTVRDLLIGIRFVGHDGRLVHAGGNVVKNVAGYDLMKVMTGSFGTLGIIKEAAFKVRPTPPNYRLMTAHCATLDEAFAVAASAMEAAPLVHCEVVGRAPMPGSPVEFTVLAGFAGVPAAIEHLSTLLREALGQGARILADAAAAAAYEDLRDYVPDTPVIAAQLAVPPAELPRQLARAVAAGDLEFRAHAGSGVAQLYQTGAPGTGEAVATVARWRQLAVDARGHLRLIAAHAEVRMRVAIFPAPPAPALALMRRLKIAFDPHGVFNPGCFVGGL